MENGEPTPLPTPRALVAMAVVFEGGLAVVAVVLGSWWGYPPAARIETTWLALVQGTAASLPMLILFLLSLRVPFRPMVNLRRVVDEFMVPLFRHCRPLELLIISVLAGLGEEMLFRGVLQEAIAGWVGGPAGPWTGVVGAAVLFGLLHPMTPSYAVLAAAIGLYLGWLQLAVGNLLVPITAHAAYDFFALAYLVKYRGKRTDG